LGVEGAGQGVRDEVMFEKIMDDEIYDEEDFSLSFFLVQISVPV
jgi:hypothetical protein